MIPVSIFHLASAFSASFHGCLPHGPTGSALPPVAQNECGSGPQPHMGPPASPEEVKNGPAVSVPPRMAC